MDYGLMWCDGHVLGSFWHVCTCPAGRAVLAGARCPAQLTCFCRVAQLFHVRAGGVSHGSVVSVVGNVPSCVPGGRDASREDLQIGVDDAGLYVLIEQLLHCVLIKHF